MPLNGSPLPEQGLLDQMVKLHLCGSSDDESEPEFDELPRGLRWRLHLGKTKTEQQGGSTVVRLGNNKVIKRGCATTEYEALRLVDRHTSIPIPKVLGVYHLREGVVVECESLPGRPLDTVWRELSALQQPKVVNDLGRFMEQLRKIEPPKHVLIGSATMGAAFDRRFGKGDIGPFYSFDRFHEYLRRGHPVSDFKEKEVAECHERRMPYVIKFTHGHLCPRNIMIDEQGRITAIVGWESAGWYPEYWEYVQLRHCTPDDMQDWLEAICRVIPRYDMEVACDAALRRRYSRSAYDAPFSFRAPSPTPSELAKERKEIDDKNTEDTSG